jgi:hypothetical protein
MPIPIRAREVFPQVSTTTSHPLYNNYMFGASNGSKVKNNNRKKKKKRSLNSSAEYGRSVAQDSESSASAYQFLPDVMKSSKSNKSGSLVRQSFLPKHAIEDNAYSNFTGPNIDTLSDEKNSGKSGNFSSGPESKDKKSSSTHSRIFHQINKEANH